MRYGLPRLSHCPLVNLSNPVPSSIETVFHRSLQPKMKNGLSIPGPLYLFLIGVVAVSASLPSKADQLVSNLPGFKNREDTKLHQNWAGYLPISEDNDKNMLFYWLFEKNVSPEEAPLIVWLNGGPGCSSMDGLFLEHGPIMFSTKSAEEKSHDGQLVEVKLNPYSWNNVANVMYVDQPVGTGFSFTHDDSYAENLREVSEQLWGFMQNFLRVHDVFVDRNIILAGESFAGSYIPNFVQYTLEANKNLQDGENLLPIEGVCIGNSYTDPYTQHAVTEYAFSVGLISEGQARVLKEQEHKCHIDIKGGESNSKTCTSLLDRVLSEAHYPCAYDIRLYQPSKRVGVYPPGGDLLSAYLNNDDVKRSIHVSNYNPRLFRECTEPPYNHLQRLKGKGSQVEAVKMMLESGVRILLYVGQFDLICNHIGIEKWLYKMEWSGAKEFHASKRGVWLSKDKKKPAGYVKSGGSLDYVIVLGAGHMVPIDVPEASLDLITRFIDRRTLADATQDIIPSHEENWTGLWGEVEESQQENKTIVLEPPQISEHIAVYGDIARVAFDYFPKGISADIEVKFRVTSTPQSLTAESNSSPIEVQGLEPGRPYTFSAETISLSDDQKSVPSEGSDAVIAGCNVGQDDDFTALPCGQNGACVHTRDGTAKCICIPGYESPGCDGETLISGQQQQHLPAISTMSIKSIPLCSEGPSLCVYKFCFLLLPGTLGGETAVNSILQAYSDSGGGSPTTASDLYPVVTIFIHDISSAFGMPSSNVHITNFSIPKMDESSMVQQSRVLVTVDITTLDNTPLDTMALAWNDKYSTLHTGLLTRGIDYSSPPSLEFSHTITPTRYSTSHTIYYSILIVILCGTVCFLCALFRQKFNHRTWLQLRQQDWGSIPSSEASEHEYEL